LIIPKISHHNIIAKAQNLIPLIDSNSIVILGDSRLEWGIKTNEITNMNGKVINLAMPGSNGLDIIQYFINNEIFPKIIIMGFCPNCGRWGNHSLDKLDYSKKNQLIANIRYWLKENSYIYDVASIKLYFLGEKPYFTNHKYDEYGNVVVCENGNYYERIKYQIINYNRLNIEYDRNEYKKYLSELKKIHTQLTGESKLLGLYMPVSDTLFSLEKTHYQKNEIDTLFDYFMDYSQFQPNNDSLYFYDGSHLSSRYAIHFTKIIDRSILSYLILSQ
jgi:hypothetical protein